MTRALPVITSAALSGASAVRHGFFTRRGGVSSGIYTALNCGPGSNDPAEHVMENRTRVLAHLDPGTPQLCGLYQIHSDRPHLLESPWTLDKAPHGDALVTRQKNIALAILTADCAPVLLADPRNHVIAAAHAGWQGALSGILENTLDLMCREGAEIAHITAAIGPCIARENYEVGPEFRQKFTARDKSCDKYFTPAARADHFLFDLKAFCHDRLARAGVKSIDIMPQDTYALEADFFSYRRATHKGEPDYGRQISTIMLAP